MTYPPLNQPNPRSGRGWFIVLGAVVLGVFIFCGIVVAAAGSKQPDDTRDVSRTGALAIPQTPVPATETANATPTSEPPATAPPATTAPATTAPATQPPTTKAPTTKAPTTKPPTKQPTTKPAGNCNPNYSPCVPNDPVDVDCKGGSGNGPSYVQGPVTVIGTDVYGLDTDHDGIGCE
ncbi:hypothetical protein ACFPIJ_03050 [Dactylosporangium cerinum]|uniref:Excalibur calcium-binding domain-containing protein n=1 Tax=Dactylosporangium cerinum TaxID=1434730 RepID=A0ABV9VKF2_9ACTN